MKRKKINKKNVLIFIGLIVMLVSISIIILVNNKDDNKLNIVPKDEVVDYSSYYSEVVKTNKDAEIYTFSDNEYQNVGIVYKDTLLNLDSLIDKNNEYFKIKDMDSEYYIKYSDVTKSDSYYDISNRYKNYIVFNKNIITDEEVTFYLEDTPLYKINKSYNLPIIIEDTDKYYVEYNNMLLSVLKEDVSEVVTSNNTNKVNTKGVPVLNYHFVYIPEEENCDQEICHPEKQFRQHMAYIKDNGYFTPTMEELELYMDGKLQLPESVVITLDDGRNINLAIKFIEEYELNATAFIVTSRFDVDTDFTKSDYVELQSHSHELHDVGTCPPGHGQGGGLTCLSDEVILEDFRLSREELNGAKAFCYPFYEYNSHSIELLKKAGFTMAFAGEHAGNKTKATVGGDKYRIPRWVIVTYTTMDTFISYVTGSV